MIEDADDTCGNCKYCLRYEDEQGECRRNPPIPAVLPDGGEATMFPVVPLEWWCGAFSRRVN